MKAKVIAVKIKALLPTIPFCIPMKNLIFGFILISIAGLTNELVAQKTKSLASRRATKLEATLNSDIAKLRKTVDEKIAKLESEFNKEASALTSETCETLEALQKAIAGDDLDLAVAIRDQVAKIKERNSSPLVKTKVAPKQNRIPKSLLGKWSGKWGTTGNSIKLDLVEQGDRVMGNVTTTDDRLLLMHAKSEYTELVPHNGGILVLGYSRSKRRHPYKTLPNHVGFVTRTN